MLSPRLQNALKVAENRPDRIRAFNELMKQVQAIDLVKATPREVARLTDVGIKAVWHSLKKTESPIICKETVPSLPEDLKKQIALAAQEVRTETDVLNARYEISEIAFFSGFVKGTADAGPV